MSSPAPNEIFKHVKYFRADDRGPVAIFIGGDFDEFDKFPPFMESEEEIRHVREAYKIEDPLLERTTKAHITDNSWPLQIIVLQVTFGKMGLKIPPEWYDRPIAFKGNATSLIGHDEPLRWPQYTQKLDYELELAAVVGLPARDVDVAEAANHILGYTLLNDFSARDTQRVEMAMSTGPYKGKDFAWGLGPWIVTPDEFGDVAGTQMRVLVNGDVWAQSTPGAMQWSFPK